MKREIGAFIKKNFFILLNYRLPSFLRFFIILLFLVYFYIATHYFSKKFFVFHLEGYSVSYFLFILTGIIFSYFLAVLTNFCSHMGAERRMGTLEALLVCPTNFTTIVIPTYIWSLIFVFVAALPIFIFGFYILKDRLISSDIFAISVIFILSVVVFAAISMLLASFIIIFEKGRSATSLVNNFFRIFGGIYFPVALLPKGLRVFSYFLPITYGMQAFRKVLFGGYTFVDIAPEITVLLIFSIILWPLGIGVLKYSIRKAKEKGSLSRY